MKWYWISVSYFTCGIATDGGKVSIAAPIVRWMIGKDIKFCIDWVNHRGGIIKELD